MLSQTSEYALRAVVWLADSPASKPVGVQPIATGTQVPASYLPKVLQELTRAGLVGSRRGVGGGYFLTRPAAEITVLEVINAVDPIRRIEGCPLGLASHQERLCAMHARMDHAIALVEEALRESTLADLVAAPDRPKPMKEDGPEPLLPIVDQS